MNLKEYLGSGESWFGPEPLHGLDIGDLEDLKADPIAVEVSGCDSKESETIGDILEELRLFVNGVLLDSGAQVMFDFHWSNMPSDADPAGKIGVMRLKATRKKSPTQKGEES